MADPWRKAETIGAGAPTITGRLARERYGDPLAPAVIRSSTLGERFSDWRRGLWDAIKEQPAVQTLLLAAGSSPEQQDRRFTEPPPEVSMGMATDRSLAAARLARQFAKDPVALRETVKPISGAYAARRPLVSMMDDALEVGRPRPADWDLRALEAGAGSPEELTRVARAYGAVSPATQFVDSLEEMYKALAMRWRGEPITRETLRAQGVGVAGAKAANLNRAFSDQPLISIDQKYPGKTETLSQLMLGHPRWVPDRHGLAMSGQGAEASVRPLLVDLREYMMDLEGRKLDPGEVYMRYEDAMRRGMQEAAGRDFGVQTYPQIWEGIRSARGEPYQRGVVDIMRDLGSAEPGALTDLAHLESVVRSGAVKRAAKAR